MRTKESLSIFLLIVLASFPGKSQTVKQASQDSKLIKIEAYYFHNTARCVTCKAVESEAKANLENLYGKMVVFQSLDLEDTANKAISEKLNISGQTLLIVKGDKQINLTNEGFMYARTNPAKFKSILKKKVDAL
jgi:hypothetical protein